MILYLGPEGTNSQEAAVRWSGGSGDCSPCRSFREVFARLGGAPAAAAVVPIENAVEGPVTQTLDLLAAASGVTITAAFGLPVRYCLAVAPGGGLHTIRRVYSHPQALAQCGNWLDAHLPEAEQKPLDSTAEAARRVAGEPAAAAVSTFLAASLYRLATVAEDIQDSAANETRFVAVVHGCAPFPSASFPGSVHSLLHLIVPNRPGSLLHMLEPFQTAGLNLTFIQSRPLQGRPWQYGFFVEVEGAITDPGYAPALARLREVAESAHILGVYPSQQNALNGHPAQRGRTGRQRV
jgi:chorismate mutase/prephenate dehydratase